MTIETPVANSATPVATTTGRNIWAGPHEALEAAIEQFPSRAAFHRALVAQAKKSIGRASVTQWVLRGRGASSDFAPAIEAISDVPCEALCPTVNWEVLRQSKTPPTYSPRNPRKGSAAGN